MSAGQTPIFFQMGAYASRALLLPLAVYAAVWWRQAQCDITIRFGPELRCKKVRSLPSGTSRLVQLSHGSTMCCIDGDDNPGRLVVLVHGFSGSSGYFEFLAECLARSRRVLRFDLSSPRRFQLHRCSAYAKAVRRATCGTVIRAEGARAHRPGRLLYGGCNRGAVCCGVP